MLKHSPAAQGKQNPSPSPPLFSDICNHILTLCQCYALLSGLCRLFLQHSPPELSLTAWIPQRRSPTQPFRRLPGLLLALTDGGAASPPAAPGRAEEPRTTRCAKHCLMRGLSPERGRAGPKAGSTAGAAVPCPLCGHTPGSAEGPQPRRAHGQPVRTAAACGPGWFSRGSEPFDRGPPAPPGPVHSRARPGQAPARPEPPAGPAQRQPHRRQGAPCPPPLRGGAGHRSVSGRGMGQ